MTNQKPKPAHEIRLGSVKAAIWCNKTEKSGTFHGVTFTRSYKSGDEWKRSDSFGRNELPLLKTVLDMAFQWIETQGEAVESSDADVEVPNI